MTFLDLVNRVLRRLRESPVTSVNDDEYSRLIGSFVNDTKEEIEAITMWGEQRQTITVDTVTNQTEYLLPNTNERTIPWMDRGPARRPQAWVVPKACKYDVNFTDGTEGDYVITDNTPSEIKSNYFISVQGIPGGGNAPDMIVTNYEGTITNPTSNVAKPVFSTAFDMAAQDTSYDISTGTWFAGGGNVAQTAAKLIRSTASVPDTDDWEDITANLDSTTTPIRRLLARNGVVIVSGANGYVELSTDNGATFSVPTLPGVDVSTVIEGLAWDAALDHYYIYQFNGAYKLWRSIDGGATWAQFGTGAVNAPTSGYAIGAHNGTVLAGAGFGNLKRTTDGNTWTTEANFDFSSDIQALATDGAGGWRVVERFGSGISYSQDDGDTWSDIFGWGSATDWITGTAYLTGKGFQEIYRQSSSIPLTLSGTITGTGSKTITGSGTSMQSNLQSGIGSADYPTS